MRPIRFSKKEKGVAVFAAALGLASLRPTDPYVVYPMLLLSWTAFLHLAYYHHGSRFSRSVFSLCVTAVLGFVGYRQSSLPKTARFHVMASTVSYNNQQPKQLIANVYIQNDGDDADISVNTSSGLAESTKDEKRRRQIIEEVKGNIPNVPKGESLTFHVVAREPRWFTVPGPLLTDEQMKKFKRGELTFYYAGAIHIRSGSATALLEYCSFVIGDNPQVIVECPVFQ